MTPAKKALSALLVVAIAGVAAWWLAARGAAGQRGGASADPAVSADGSRDDAPGRPRSRARTAEPDSSPAPPPATPSPPTAESPRAAGIRVVTNVPGAEVTVTFRHYGGAPESAPSTKRADPEGVAVFDLPEHPDELAEASVRATAPGHASAEASVQGADGARGTDVRLTLVPGVPLRGRVVSEDGAPIERATVTLAPDRWTSTSVDGTFEAWAAAAGPVVLSVDDAAHLPAEVRATAPSDGIAVLLARGGQIRGRVAFPDLRPLPGAQVQAALGGRFVVATADDDGRYALSGLPDGEIEVSCGAADAPRKARAGATDADFVVKNAVARIRFVDEEGRPFRNAALWVRGFLGEDEVFSSASAGGSDPVHLVDVPPGTRLQISPSAKGYERRVTEVTLDGAPSLRDVPVVIRRAGPSGAIDLRVLDATGAPRRETTLSISNEADAVVGDWYGKKLALDASGRARIEDLPPGALRLIAGAERHGLPSASYDLAVIRDVQMTAGASVAFEIVMGTGGRLVVAVRNSAGDVVPPRGWLTVLDAEGKSVPGMFWQENEKGGWTSSSDGSSLSGVGSGPGSVARAA